ncbi:MAG: tRNA preQ1(34) S-adenosylmethionine ribosyltransferase-isomerase QueA [Sedimentisphaerales bacterium]|nr:tRNA preQ1(34) S-adenosylmethionine ribosyltransferase-isomerase QueA [Sedimentisphaerales bacterium]
MKTEALDYYLPEELIAQQPAARRSDSRLLVLERRDGRLTDSRFADIGEFLREGDCLVLNDTKVLAARFFARRKTGGKLEGLFLEQPDKGVWEVMLKGLGKVKAGERIRLKDIHGEDFCCAEVVEKKGEGKCVLMVETDGPAEKSLERIGFAPVPPYIKRDADLRQAVKDKERYQTVYARQPGAVAAPTAGLHFTKELIGQLESGGIKVAYITLHVGEGTFKPVTAERIEGHEIHPERFSIDVRNTRIINEAKEKGGRIIAVGTTSVRAIETVAAGSRIQANSGQTRLFITPGYRFKMVDAMVTNFHLPRSTLLALVAAFAGLDTVLAAYRHAVEERYRFYSYGDAMLIT